MNTLIKALIAFAASLIIGLVGYPFLIPLLKKIKFGQHVRDDLPKEHQGKEGVPTMGGILFLIVPVVVCTIMQIDAYKDFNYLVMLLGFIGFGLIGLLDDVLIIIKKQSIGLKTLEKLALQIVLSLVIFFIYRNSNSYSEVITLPFSKISFNTGWFYGVIVFFMFAGETNAVNVTDGLDGLSSGLIMLAYIPYLLFTYKLGLNYEFVFLASVMGIVLAYYRYNFHPAKIFMGDTGSLALGGLFSALGLVTKQELLLLIVGLVFLIEVISCAIQIFSFRVFKKRVFKMAPIHHHFELCGFSQMKIVVAFYIVGAICCIIGVVAAMI